MKNSLIISYPKSGSTWLSYIIEYITKIRVVKIGKIDKRQLFDMDSSILKSRNHQQESFVFDTDFEYKEGVIKMFRAFGDIEIKLDYEKIMAQNENPEIMICLIRNPIVCCLRNRNDKWWSYIKESNKKKANKKKVSNKKKVNIMPNISDFTIEGIGTVIDFYDFFPGEKIMIKYEDMIYNIQNTLSELADILSVDDYTEFLDNIDIHRERCLFTYRKRLAQKSFSIENPYNILELEEFNFEEIIEKIKKNKNVYKIWRKYYENDPTNQTLA